MTTRRSSSSLGRRRIAAVGRSGPARSPGRGPVAWRGWAALVATTAPPAAAAASSAPGKPSPIDPERAIEPLTTIDSLVQVAVSVLETGEPADDLERVLDAVGRLSADRSPSFTRSTAAIARRARTILARRESRPFNGVDARADIAGVLLAWASGELVEPVTVRSPVDPGAGAFLSTRAREIAEAASAARAFVSVAAPTHAGGGSAAVLVERLDAGPPASTLDLVAAILGCARRAGRCPHAAAASRRGGCGRRHALGAMSRWADPSLVGGRREGSGTGRRRSRRRTRIQASTRRRSRREGPTDGRRPATFDRRLSTRDRAADAHRDERGPATVLMLLEPSLFAWSGHSEPPCCAGWRPSSPASRGLVCHRCLALARNVDWWSAEWANRAFLEPFIDPATTIGPLARTLLDRARGEGSR
jgi:hypothetical protein